MVGRNRLRGVADKVPLVCEGCRTTIGMIPSGSLPNGTFLPPSVPAHVAFCQFCAPDDVKVNGVVQLTILEIVRQEAALNN